LGNEVKVNRQMRSFKKHKALFMLESDPLKKNKHVQGKLRSNALIGNGKHKQKEKQKSKKK
jgi:hypothetical protein